MNQFLVVVPKASRGTLDPTDASARQSTVAQRVAASYRSFLGQDEDPEPIITPASSNGTATVLSFRRIGQPKFAAGRGDVSLAVAGQQVGNSLMASIQRLGGRLIYRFPVFGRYSVVYCERWMDHITAWSTVPGFEGIHWGEDDEHVFVSNRPLLVALGLANGSLESVRLSERYVYEYLTVGYSLTGQSPFHAVATVPVGHALSVHGGRVTVTEMPSGLESDLPREHTVDEGADALSGALRRATERAIEDMDGRPLTLRLSGGKDSRLMLGMFRAFDVPISTVTFGVPTDPDVRLASHLATMAGVPHEIRPPRLLTGTNEDARIVDTLRQAGGMPLSEPHTIRYVGADLPGPGHAIALGQWPLFKGGMARTMTNSRDATRRRLDGALSTLVSDDVRRPFAEWLEDWIQTQPAASELEKQYLFARSFRSGPYLQPHTIHYSRDGMIAYPFGDHEVAAVSDVLTMPEKVSERSFFGALQRIWPEVMRVPLDRSGWRFEAGGPDPSYSGDHYADRMGELPPVPGTRQSGAATPIEHGAGIVRDLVEALRADDHLDWAASLVHPAVADSLNALAARGSLVVPAGVAPREFTKFVWRLRTADLWRSRAWM
ncbi:Asparagine synthase [Micrococcus luteus]|uniref:Asparagine synthase n=2 Tax=Micrococcus TaxID=1269 RepID=A0ABD7M4W3_MICLU|nr:hypothetical protein [Micrococcus luteus]SHL30385.1 Asparagine synthase [Micrococcus luteus]